MKIVLTAINASYTHTNPAVRCIQKSLRAAGYDCSIAEFNIKDKRRRILEALAGANADIYGFSTYIWNAKEMYSFASDLKALKPSALIVFGGPEVSFDTDEIFAAHPFIDCIITGEGEAAFVKLADMYERGGTVPSVINGGIFDGFDTQGCVYTEAFDSPRIVYYESSRGCPFRCAYCLSGDSAKVRAKSAQTTLCELSHFELIDNVKIVKFVDRTFNFDAARAKEIWRGLLDARYTKSYHFEICAELLDEESFEILKAFPKGKIQLEIGVQSTNPDTLRRVDRSPKTDKLIENITRLHGMGNIHIHADLIAGLPGEDFASFARSFDALYGRCDMLQLGFLKLLRGSKLRRTADDFGCVYSAEAPYEVLSTDAITFEQLCRLHDIDDVNDRYSSDAFARSMRLIMSRSASPFYTLLKIADGYRRDGFRISDVSQPRAYELLYKYVSVGDDRTLSEALVLDFLTSQKLSAPSIGGFELKKGSDRLKRDFMRYADVNGIEYFAPALECREGTREYVIDRRNMRAFMLSKNTFVQI